MLESTLKCFWTSEEAVSLREGTMQKILTGASTDFNVALARALANTRPDKYEASLEGSQGAKTAAAKHNVQRWNYIAALERLTQERELEANQLFTRFLDAQSEIAQLHTERHASLVPEIEAAQEEIKAKSSLTRRFSKAQSQYGTRLALAIDRVQISGASVALPGVHATDNNAEGLLFMCPVVLSDGAVGKAGGRGGKGPPWLPTWASVDFSSGVFRFDAEWQGPVPGMDRVRALCSPPPSIARPLPNPVRCDLPGAA